MADRGGREATRPACPVARDWLRQALGRACLALRDPDCAPILGPPVPGATLPLGARVPGTSLELDPASAAFNLGAMIVGARPGPADHVAAALAAADYAARHAHYDGVAPPTVADLLAALRQAVAFAGSLAADAQCRDDPWLCQRAADAFVATALLGGTAGQQFTAAHRASLDGSPAGARDAGSASPSPALRRAAGENAARALRHALAVLRDGATAGGAALAGPAPDHAPGPTPRAAPSSPPEPADLDAAFAAAVAAVYPAAQAAAIGALFEPGSALEALTVDAFVARLVRN
jgi:2-methylcitrate dehydratase